MITNFDAYNETIIDIMENDNKVSFDDFAVCNGKLTLCKFTDSCTKCDLYYKFDNCCSVELIKWLSDKYENPKVDLKVGDIVINNFTGEKAVVKEIRINEEKRVILTIRYNSGNIDVVNYKFWRKGK